MTAPLQPIFEALAFSLLHFVWQGTVVAGAYKLIDVALPRLRPHVQYVIGLAALLVMAVVGCATFAYEFQHSSQQDALATGLLIGRVGHQSMVMAMAPLLDAGWLLGVAILSARMMTDLWKIQRLTALAYPVPSTVAQSFSKLMERAGLKQSIRIRFHAGISGPIVVGIFRSAIYLPVSAISALTPDQLDTVIAHELEHIRRADYIWNIVQTLIETLFFFHPAVWWIGGKLRVQRELCCDDAAVAVCSDPLVYATALLTLEKRCKAALSLAMALGGQEKGLSLLERISRILGEAPPAAANGRHGYAAAILPLLALAALMVLTSTTQVVARPNPLPSVPVARAMSVAVATPAVTAATPIRPRVASPARHPVMAENDDMSKTVPPPVAARPETGHQDGDDGNTVDPVGFAADPMPDTATPAVAAALPAPPAPAVRAAPPAPPSPAAASIS